MFKIIRREKQSPIIEQLNPGELEKLILELTFPQSLLAFDQLAELANGDSPEAKAAINRIDSDSQLQTQLLILRTRKPTGRNYNPLDKEDW